eukprot:gene11109-12375_t
MKILILGDGNFSFSLAAAHRLHDYHHVLPSRLDHQPIMVNHQVELIATSFDSREALDRKYPESTSLLTKLSKFAFVRVMHGVDGTHLEKQFSTERGEVFEEIWFNFPHLGKEDLHCHQSLIAHYFHSAKAYLKEEGKNGFISVALSEEQQENWEIHKSASRLGLKCIAAVPVLAEQWPGYELKRHHTGRSFATRVQNCFHYCFCRVEENDDQQQRPLLEILFKNYQTIPSINPSDGPSSSVLSDSVKEGKKEKKNRKRVHLLVEGKYCRTAEGGFQCQECSRLFPTEQGIRTHVYNVHILAGEKQLTRNDQQWTCSQCGKSCHDADSLRQHEIAKHTGAHLHILPYWKQEAVQQIVTTAAASEFVCPICEHDCESSDGLEDHLLNGLQPVETSNSFNCPVCAKVFSQERALLQHSNFCSNNKTILRTEDSSLV